jgi:hypothetical protein
MQGSTVTEESPEPSSRQCTVLSRKRCGVKVISLIDRKWRYGFQVSAPSLTASIQVDRKEGIYVSVKKSEPH